MSRLPDMLECGGTLVGFASGIILNAIAKKHPYAGFHKHIVFMAVGYGVGHAASRYLAEVRRRRALHVEDYINAHPEHFDEVFKPDLLWKDKFIKWHPQR